MTVVYLGLGSNLGDRLENLREALRRLKAFAHVEAVSAVYESAPQPPAPPPDYLNAACRIITELAPLELLRRIKQIEAQMGRTGGPSWAPRPIDIDIELYGDQIIETDELTVPHPRLIERNFVLQPLVDIDSDLAHPVTGERLEAALGSLGLQGLRQMEPLSWAAT